MLITVTGSRLLSVGKHDACMLTAFKQQQLTHIQVGKSANVANAKFDIHFVYACLFICLLIFALFF